MKTLKLIMMLGLGAMVSACATTDTATRNARFDTVPPQVQQFETLPAQQFLASAPTNFSAAFNVQQINVLVPQSLKVSERNSYYPGGDIVWREDPIGNRHAQVKAIFDTGFAKGTDAMAGDAGLRLDVKVLRFHALTEKARYTTGGVHSIKFALWIRDAKSGQALGEVRIVDADLDALGGQQAINAEARGQTQKVRITDHLAEVIRQELSNAEGFTNPKLGMIQQLKKI
ncbi:MAG: hypothetical protein P8Q26_12495 [Ascidiaceihabitans sp.]|nr:hypothetical protein [Ascidiaceihabitans sp.]